jgi:hypothetical protein
LGKPTGIPVVPSPKAGDDDGGGGHHASLHPSLSLSLSLPCLLPPSLPPSGNTRPGGEHHQHRHRYTFEVAGKQQLLGWLESGGDQEGAVTEEAGAVSQQRRAPAAWLRLAINCTSGLARLCSASHPTQTPVPSTRCSTPRCGEHMAAIAPPAVSRSSNHRWPVWAFGDAINARASEYLGGWRALFHLPQATGSGRWGFVYIHDLHRPPGQHRPW